MKELAKDLMSRTKESLVHELARFDVSCFRKNGLYDTGKYAHEPAMFRVRLHKLYDKLSKEDIIQLLKIRKR